eukprot:scaffold90498_cov32-Tisochrysis_lutea.AAC.2
MFSWCEHRFSISASAGSSRNSPSEWLVLSTILMAARVPVSFCRAAHTVPKEPAPRTEMKVYAAAMSGWTRGGRTPSRL